MVRPGQQLRTNNENEHQYEQKKKLLQKPLSLILYCNFPRLTQQFTAATANRHILRQLAHSTYLQEINNHKGNTMDTINRRAERETFHLPSTPSSKDCLNQQPTPNDVSPQQLAVPASVGSWNGNAILDTGSSYALNNKVWKQFRGGLEADEPLTSRPSLSG